MKHLQTATCGKFFISNVIRFRHIIIATAILVVIVTNVSHGDTPKVLDLKKISLQRLEGLDSGFGYRLQYYVAAPLDQFWRFKTDFDSDVLLTSDELIGHRLVDITGNRVITENRYASAPSLKFLWQTTVLTSQYRLEFELLNASECRHKFHNGFITLEAAGDFTLVTQTAYFDFTGASIWVSYPWYGGMKYTLTKVAKWEQTMALQHAKEFFYAGSGKSDNVCTSIPVECEIQR
jgi:hypothetical protein